MYILKIRFLLFKNFAFPRDILKLKLIYRDNTCETKKQENTGNILQISRTVTFHYKLLQYKS